MQDQVLRAPIEGTVQQPCPAHDRRRGDAGAPGADGGGAGRRRHIEIEAMVLNKDIGFVHDGDAAEIKVDTFNFTRYGLLHGKGHQCVAGRHDARQADQPEQR